MQNYPCLTVTEKAETLLRGGHPWVFADEVDPAATAPADGSLVHIFSRKQKFLGTGFYNGNSKIRIRLVSRNANDTFDAAFWRRRLQYAVDYRKTVMGPEDFRACRLIFGEADTLPGLTVDRYENVLVTQVLSLGIERIKPLLYDTLVSVLRDAGQTIDAIYERNDVAIRALEGMTQSVGFYGGAGLRTDLDGAVDICENGLTLRVDYREGQKTGYFLDQKYNRLAIRPIARGRRVLDCFTHTGGFALNAAAGGAVMVNAVDVSADALAMARFNARRNGLEQIRYTCADVFELLSAMERQGDRTYDFIILDPPAFTKSRDTLKNAIRGYREINRAAMRLLPRGGYLATCSCSHFMTETYFRQMLHNAAEDVGVSLRQIEARRQSPDHPILWNVPETDYLKFYIFQIV